VLLNISESLVLKRCEPLAMHISYEKAMAVVGSTLLLLAAFIVAYYAITVPVERAFGERYVSSEIPLIFPFYLISTFKPLTLIVYCIFAGVVLLLEAGKENLRRLDARLDTRGAKIVLVFGAFASAYEVIWNFLAWFATWQKTGGLLDLVANSHHEYNKLPVNFNFATKVSFLILALCVYGAIFLSNIEGQTKARH
jgi:hypothetical protein